MTPSHSRAAGRRAAVVAAAVLVCGLAHQSATHPQFAPRRVPIAGTEMRPAQGRVTLSLPDLSSLRGSAIVLRAELGSDAPRSGRLRVQIDGLTRAEVNLGAGSSTRADVVVSGGAAQALSGTGQTRHRIDVVGDDDGWRLIAMDAANVHLAVERPVVIAVVPARVPPAPAHATLAWGILAALGVAAGIWGSRRGRGRLAAWHAAAAAVVLAACAAAAVLPRVSGYRVLAAPVVFWAGTALVFAPGLIGALRVSWRTASRLTGHPSVTAERAAILLGLVALVIALPIFEVVRASPEFFVARNTSLWSALAAAALIGVALPGVLILVERGIRLVSPAASAVFFHTLVGILGAALVHPWLRRADAAAPWVMAGLAAGSGALLALLAWRVAEVRKLLRALGFAALVVPALFFGRAEIWESFATPVSHAAAATLARTPPIVLVVFDEFPLHSLLDAAGGIDPVRYPNFAALAREGTWFRETTTVSSQTVWAVPAIASGRYPTAPNAVPTLRYYPDNLFTLLAGRYEMFVFGRFLQLCPAGACQRDAAGPSDGALPLAADLAVVWLHIVSPQPVVDRLPPVVGDWLGFAQRGRWRTVNGRRVRNDRRDEFDRFLSTIDARPARLYFLHSLLPHMPFEYVPSERRYDAPDYQGRNERGAGLFERVDAAYADALHQRHLLQVGFVDSLVGRLVARLRALGIYDEAVLVVTADHGASYRERMPRRAARRQNLADIIRVPLLIKLPAQKAGGTADGPVESVDILPTIADALGTRLPFAVDGVSLAGGIPARASRTFIDRGTTRIARRDVSDWRATSEASLARRLSRFGDGRADTLFAVPGTGSLLGRAAADLSRAAAAVRVDVEGVSRFENVDLAAETLPLHVRGRVLSRRQQPLAVVVNGRIAATTMPFEERGATWFATMIPEQALRQGRNEVEVVAVE